MTRKQITFRMSNDLYEGLRRLAERKQISINNLIVNVLWKQIKH